MLIAFPGAFPYSCVIARGFSLIDQLLTWGRYLLLRISVALLIQPESEDLQSD